MKQLRIRQAFIYWEDDFWTWQIVDIGGRVYFADTLYPTREDARSGIVDALGSIVASLDGNKN